VRGGVKVIYSRLGEKADSVIKRILSTERREWIVVSSDREIANHAWATDSIPVPSEEFLPFLEGTGTAVIPSSGKDGDDTELREERKGNPRKPSRKERAMNRALGKL
jgi:predicted RNA-binding protein with PIN domain